MMIRVLPYRPNDAGKQSGTHTISKVIMAQEWQVLEALRAKLVCVYVCLSPALALYSFHFILAFVNLGYELIQYSVYIRTTSSFNSLIDRVKVSSWPRYCEILPLAGAAGSCWAFETTGNKMQSEASLRFPLSLILTRYSLFSDPFNAAHITLEEEEDEDP